jgi:hypothetical protein
MFIELPGTKSHMVRERWGTFSVIDHRNSSALATDVLLYDRLVIPTPTRKGGSEKEFDPNELQRWKDKGWEPELLINRLQQLGDIAIPVEWNSWTREYFHQWRSNYIDQIRKEARQYINVINYDDRYLYERLYLRDEKSILAKVKGITRAVVVAAYQSANDFKADFHISSIEQNVEDHHRLSNLGLLLGNKIEVPEGENNDPEKALNDAIKLAQEKDFKRKREKLYKWQEDIIRDGVSDTDALYEMDQMIKEYNECVRSKTRHTLTNLVFAIAPLAATLVQPFIPHIPNFLEFSVITSAIGVVKAVKLELSDRKPNPILTESEPAAMFHEIDKHLGWVIL